MPNHVMEPLGPGPCHWYRIQYLGFNREVGMSLCPSGENQCVICGSAKIPWQEIIECSEFLHGTGMSTSL